jgi:ribosome-interacting GTPase 1
MPANLSPEYKLAEAAYRKAREPKVRLEYLREMLRVIPKHKGTEHLQADIKARIKDLTGELEHGPKGGGRTGPALVVRPEGAAQIALLGPPNAGKSLLHARLTASHAHDAPYPFTTQFPEPGMMPHEDIHFQLVDLPAVASEHPVPWLASALQMADAALLVIDLSESSCVEQVQEVRTVLRERRVSLAEAWPAGDGATEGVPAADDDPFALRLPTLLIANKIDLVTDVAAELEVFRELAAVCHPTLPVSAATGRGLAEIGPFLFQRLGIVRVYTKLPGKHADHQRPFTLRRGQKVRDVAHLVHKDLERTLRYARITGHSGFEGQQVGPDHVLQDGDVVELHA